MSTFILRFEDNCHEHAEKHRRRNAACRGGKSAGKCAQNPLLGHSLGYPLSQTIAEARQGHRGSGSAPIHHILIHAHRLEQHPRYHITREDPGWGELRLVDEQLADGAQHAAA